MGEAKRKQEAARQQPPARGPEPAMQGDGPVIEAKLTELDQKALLPYQSTVQQAIQNLQGVFRGILAGKGIDPDEWNVTLPLQPGQITFHRRKLRPGDGNTAPGGQSEKPADAVAAARAALRALRGGKDASGEGAE